MKKLALATAALAMGTSAHSQVVINEIMQSNIDCIMDDLNDFPDSWVELYNTGDQSVDLGEYSIGTKDKASKACALPSAMLQPGAYRLVYCDKSDEGAFQWHTTFRLESGKDATLYLFHNGEIVDQLPEGLKKQPAPNVAYGRETDGSDVWGYQLTPTPGSANTGQICSAKDILEVPVMSVAGKIIRSGESLSVEITMPEGTPDGTVIRYTTDGSEPTEQSQLYTQALNVNGSTVLRAKPFCEGYLSPRSVVQSYICFDRDVTMPVVSIVTDNRYLHDQQIGLLYEGNGYSSDQENFRYNWRRPMNFEFWDGDLQESCINQLGEARLTGQASRNHPLKSMGIYANKRFGEKRFNHEFFPEQRPGITDFKSLMLRNAGNDFDYLYMRDAVIQCHMQKYVDLDWQAYQPAIVFINGEYKGLLNIRERSNEDNIYTNYAGLEDIDMVENWWELKEGNIEAWHEFQDFFAEHGHSYDEYNQIMDVQEFMDVMILNLFFCNLDFPGNNIVHWKPQAEGGRWRVIVKDTDFGLGLYGRSADYKVLEWLYNPDYDEGNSWANGYGNTRLFRRLMEDEKFYNDFIDRFAIYMGDFMNFERTWETWEPMYEAIKDEYTYHREQFNPWWPNYNEELDGAKSWLKTRVGKMYSQLSDFYNLGKPVDLTIATMYGDGGQEIGSVGFNGWQLSRNRYKGKFFTERSMLLTAENADGWIIKEKFDGKSESYTIEGGTLTYAIPAGARKVEITAYSGIVTVEDDPVVNMDGKTIFEGEQLIDWWNAALVWGPEYFGDFARAEAIVVDLELENPADDSHFKFQMVNPDWSQTPFPSQEETPDAWTNGEGDIHVVMHKDGVINIPMQQDDVDLVNIPGGIQIMLVGSNTIIKQVVLVGVDENGIAGIESNSGDGISYNLMGIPVDCNYKGLVIRNGRKYLQR